MRVEGTWGSEARAGRNAELCAGTTPSASGVWRCTLTVPARILAQLRERNQSFPLHYDLDPTSTNDANTPWLAPGRLLVWVKYFGLLNATLNVSGSLDGAPLLVRKAYNTIVPVPRRRDPNPAPWSGPCSLVPSPAPWFETTHICARARTLV